MIQLHQKKERIIFKNWMDGMEMDFSIVKTTGKKQDKYMRSNQNILCLF